MHLSLCHLCASNDGASLTNIYSDEGKRSNLHVLINQYISPIICLPKEDKLCVCDMCKTRLQSWDSFIDSCKKAQKKLKDLLGRDKHVDLLSLTKESIGPGESLSPPRKRKSSNYCIARWCNNNRNYQGISLFRLPRERERALKWLSAAERTDLQSRTVLHSYYLCAKHFTSNMFTNKASNQLIKKAIPTIFPKLSHANKKASTAVTSQVQPTQLQGVQLQYILPKMSLPKNPETQPAMIVMNNIQRVPTTIKNPHNPVDTIFLDLSPKWSQKRAPMDGEQDSGVVINVISSEMCETVDTYGNVMNISNLDLPSAVHLNSSNPGPSQNDSGTSASLGVQENCNVVDSLVTWSPPPCVSQVLSTVSEIRPSSQCASMLSQFELKRTMSSGNSNSKSKPGVHKDQKLYLEELEECFTSDAFNEDAMLSTDCTSDSLKSKKLSRIIGSQDFLLPHVSVKLDKSAPSCSAASFALKSDVTNEIQEEAKEQNTTMDHDMNPNNNSSLFDLNTDDTHVTDNSSFINTIGNLDDLMDLDHYFAGR